MNPILGEYLGTTALLSSIAYVGTPVVVAATVLVVKLLLERVSGGHINPAVTVWAFLSGSIGKTKAVSYILAQVAAAITVFLLKTRA